MKIRVYMAALLCLTAFVLAGCTSAAAPVDAPAQASAPAEGGQADGTVQPADAPPAYITEEEAKAVALDHAGLADEDVTYLKAELDLDDGRAVYEIDFYAGNFEFEYEIDAVSGDILHADTERERLGD